MNKSIAAVFAILLPISALAQTNPWRAVAESSITSHGERQIVPKVYRTIALDTEALDKFLARAPREFTSAAKTQKMLLALPRPDGKMATFRIEESPILSAEVAREKPDWKSYSGRGVDDPTALVRLSWSAEGFRAYVIDGDGSYLIDPYAAGDRKHYVVYFKHDASGSRGEFHCKLDEFFARNPAPQNKNGAKADAAATPDFSNGPTLRTYRLAIATTGEYTVDRGGQTSAFTDVMNAVNRINLIYRRDVAVAFTLVSGTNTIFPDPSTDPYDNSDNTAQLQVNQTQLDTIIGAANYDIGHLFGTGGGGVATTPSVCSTQKAEGYSARVPPTGDAFWVDYVAHEIGHQFSAEHTYNTLESGPCSTRSATDAYEVASGSTIMSYVGICDERNLQQFSSDLFHSRSLTQILAELANPQGGGSCGTPTATGNKAPSVNAGANFTIPRLTPFTLTATGADPDVGDSLTYSWEQYDIGASASGPNGTPPNTFDIDTDGVLRPLFRVYAPTASASRTFPSLTYILNNANTPPLTFTGTSPTGSVCAANTTCVTGENLPSVARTLNFRVAVRDNNGGVADAATQVVVDAASGPFNVTAPNTASTMTGGTQFTVTWNVANTSAAPVSAANVKISASTDGGLTFPTVLLASTPNDGSETVTLPNVNSTTARLKVEAVGNIFFDVSDANFTITGGAPTPTPTKLANISTRMRVQTGDNVLIGGFIVSGTQPKPVIVRAIGPSLNVNGTPVAGRLLDSTLELVGPGGSIATNDNWRTTQEAAIIASTVPPPNDLESAIVATLPANNTGYTAIVRGAGNTSGVGLVEVFDLDRSVDSQLANISTRGLILTQDDVMIGGTILVGTSPRRIIVRAIGPSLNVNGTPVPGRLEDSTLDLVNQNGAVIATNDNWRSTQEAEIIATTVPPPNDLESAIVATLVPANYTAIVRGKNGTTGVGLVEVFVLND